MTLRQVGWAALVVAVVAAGVVLAVAVWPHPQWRPGDPEVYAAQVVARTNAARVDEGLPALAVSPCAREQAVQRAEHLIGHVGLLVHEPLDPVSRACPDARANGENLSRLAAPPADVVAAWLDSPAHRANLLSPAFSEVGVACVVDRGEMACSQVFLGSGSGLVS